MVWRRWRWYVDAGGKTARRGVGAGYDGSRDCSVFDKEGDEESLRIFCGITVALQECYIEVEWVRQTASFWL